MESAKRGASGEPAARPDGQRLRPQPVLDLTAAEVASAPAAASAETEPSAASETGTAESGPWASQDPPDPPPPEAVGPAAAEVLPAEAPAAVEESAAAAAPVSPKRRSTVATAAVVGAAAGALGALGILWMLGLGAGRDNRAADAARVGRLEAQVRELAARALPTQNAASELAARVAAGEEALQNVKDLQARLAQAEATLRSLPAAADPPLDQRVANLDGVAQQLDQSVNELRRRLDEIAANAQAARDAAMRSAGSSTTAAASVASEVESLTKRVQALETAAQTLQAAVVRAAAPEPDRAARFAVAALALRTAVERGEPFVPELAAVQTLARDPAPLAPLQAFAATGLPSAEALARELSALIADQRRETDITAGGGVLERVQQAAARLVRIRPVDAPAQEASGDMFVNLKAAAARGDIGSALAEAGKLPETQRTRLASWMTRAQARTAAAEAARAIVREALGALGAAPGEPPRR